MGINTGAFLGALIAGYLGEVYGWAYGFGAAGVGMLLGLVVFVWGKPALKGAGEPSNPALLADKIIGPLSREHTIWAGALVTTLIVWFLVRSQGAVNLLLLASMIVTYLFIVWRAVAKLNPHQRGRIIVALVLISTNVLFWGLFEQAGSSLNIFTDEHVDRNLLGWEVPASMFQSINALYIMTLGPVFAALWIWLSKKGWEPSAPMKFALALMQLGLGFLVLVFGAAGDGLTPVIFIFLIYLLHTTGELCMSPVGLSAMTRLSVTSMVGLMMGAWFLASGAGNAVAALIAQATASGGEGVGQVLGVYTKVGWVAIIVGVLFAVASPFLTKMMHLQTLEADDLSEDVGTVDTGGSNTDPGAPDKTLG